MSKRIATVLIVVVVVVLGALGVRLLVDSPATPEHEPAADARGGGDGGATAEMPVKLRGAGPQGEARDGGVVGAGAGGGGVDGLTDVKRPGAGTDTVPPTPAGGPLAPITGVVKIGAWPAREGAIRVVVPAAIGQAADFYTILAPLDEDGRFHLAAPKAGSVSLAIEIPGRQERTVVVRVHAREEPGDPIEVVFGEGRIFGVVRDAQGAPLGNTAVRLSTYLLRGEEGSGPSAEGDMFSAALRTEPDGTYAFTDLPAGRFILVATTAPGRSDARNIRSFEVTLAADESRRFDIGGVTYDPTWTGTVRYEDGTAVQRAGNLFLETEDGERRLYVSFDAEGRYAQAVPPGTYRIELVVTRPQTLGYQLIQTPQRITMLPSGAVDDVVFPGARLTGRVQGAAPRRSPMGPPEFVVLTLVSSETERPPSLIASEPTRVIRVSVASDGAFAADGLYPGVWSVSGSLVQLVGEDGRPVRLTSADGVRPAELNLVRAAPGAGGDDAGR